MDVFVNKLGQIIIEWKVQIDPVLDVVVGEHEPIRALRSTRLDQVFTCSVEENRPFSSSADGFGPLFIFMHSNFTASVWPLRIDCQTISTSLVSAPDPRMS